MSYLSLPFEIVISPMTGFTPTMIYVELDVAWPLIMLLALLIHLSEHFLDEQALTCGLYFLFLETAFFLLNDFV